MILTRSYTRVSNFKLEKKSWWVSPTGELYSSGDDHKLLMAERQDLFPGMKMQGEAVRAGWTRVGLFGAALYITTQSLLNSSQLKAVQDLYLHLGSRPQVEYDEEGRGGDISILSGEDFLMAKSPGQLRRGLKARYD